jgi:hypothetical protein
LSTPPFGIEGKKAGRVSPRNGALLKKARGLWLTLTGGKLGESRFDPRPRCPEHRFEIAKVNLGTAQMAEKA